MAKKKRVTSRVIGPSFYVVQPEKVKKTRYIMRPSGLLAGRTTKIQGSGDRTKVIRLKRDVDINRDGRIDSRDLRKGQIVGRVGRGKPRPKQVKVRTHMRKGRLVKKYRRSRKV